LDGRSPIIDRVLEAKAAGRVSACDCASGVSFDMTDNLSARIRMDAVALHNIADPFAGTSLGTSSDEVLGDVWDWCTLRGCRSVTYAGRVHTKTSRFDKYRYVRSGDIGRNPRIDQIMVRMTDVRLRYVVLAGGMLITFKIKKNQAFHERKKRFSLFGSYVYSGMMAHDELYGQTERDALANHPRVYQDGMQVSPRSYLVRSAV
jgi:hypothetical protein